jgi:hypothetical protein
MKVESLKVILEKRKKKVKMKMKMKKKKKVKMISDYDDYY